MIDLTDSSDLIEPLAMGYLDGCIPKLQIPHCAAWWIGHSRTNGKPDLWLLYEFPPTWEWRRHLQQWDAPVWISPRSNRPFSSAFWNPAFVLPPSICPYQSVWLATVGYSQKIGDRYKWVILAASSLNGGMKGHLSCMS